MARTSEEEQRRRRRKRLVRGLVMGGAAVGLPALANALVSRRARRLPALEWGSGDRYRWREGEIAFHRLGEGPPLVLLHSFGPGHSAVEWQSAAELLARGHQVYAPDLLGWGQSEKPTVTYDAGLYIELLADFLRQAVGEPAVVVAAGLPAAYAVQVAADRSERVRALALIVPQGIGLSDDGPDFKDAVVHRLLRLPVLGTSALNLFTSRTALGAYLRRDVYGSPGSVGDALVDEHYRASHQDGARLALAAHLSGTLNHGVRDVLSGLELPVWIAWGRRATNPPIETADFWLQRLPGAELEVFESCGLLPHAESPAELCAKLESFLATLDC